MKGGIKAWDGLTAAGPADMGLSVLNGDVSAKEIIGIAYGMEEGLGELYRRMSGMKDDPEAAEIFTRLAGFEDKHKERLIALYRSLDPGVEATALAQMAQDNAMIEGGFTPDAFLERNRADMKTVPDILNMAMMLEAQAMDLYHRYSQKIGAEDARDILYDIAEEEKDHLKRLGQLMEERS